MAFWFQSSMAVRISCSPERKLEPLSLKTEAGFPLRLMNLRKALIKESVSSEHAISI